VYRKRGTERLSACYNTLTIEAPDAQAMSYPITMRPRCAFSPSAGGCSCGVLRRPHTGEPLEALR
jgi:hypothetical protein